MHVHMLGLWTPRWLRRSGGGPLQFGSGQVKAKELCFGSDGATMERYALRPQYPQAGIHPIKLIRTIATLRSQSE
jgi:hypothetical protein